MASLHQRVQGRDGVVVEHDWGHLYSFADGLISRARATSVRRRPRKRRTLRAGLSEASVDDRGKRRAREPDGADRLARSPLWLGPPPSALGLLTLIGVRNRLRQRNLHDTGVPEASPELIEKLPTPPIVYGAASTERSTISPAPDGQHRHALRSKRAARQDLPEPTRRCLTQPRMISRELLTRERFLPATTLNVLAAAWIQFEVHDWFSHGKNEEENPWELALAEDDDWPERPMAIPRTRRDPTSDEDPRTPDTFLTDDSHWWDGSQIYGSDERFAAAARSREDGKLRVEDGLPRATSEQAAASARPEVASNFWVGLALLHTLFTLEHNAICDRLRREFPGWSDDRLYDKARLINAALDGKDPHHRVDSGDHRSSHQQVRAARDVVRNRRRAPGQEAGPSRLGRSAERNPRLEDHPRLPLLAHRGVRRRVPDAPPDPGRVLVPLGGRGRGTRGADISRAGRGHVRERLEEIGVANALYSFGIAHPGAISLHNYPRFLQRLERPDGTRLDLAATDILRIRERGVPRTPVPPALSAEACQIVRGADRQPGRGRTDPACL